MQPMNNQPPMNSQQPAVEDDDAGYREQEASEIEQAQYDFLMYACSAVIGSPGQIEKSIKVITDMEDVAIGTGFLVGSVVFDLTDECEAETQSQIEQDAITEVCKDLIEELLADLETAGIMNPDAPQEETDAFFTASLHTAVTLAMGEAMQSGKMNAEKVKAGMVDLLDTNGIDISQYAQQQPKSAKQSGGVLANMRPA